MTEQTFPFRFDPAYRKAAMLFGVTPANSIVTVTDTELRVRFGMWRLSALLTNVADVQQTGGFAFVKTAGPPHLSLTDRGVTFATNGDQAVCVQFHEPVKALDPTGRFLQHPGATITVADPAGLAAALTAGR